MSDDEISGEWMTKTGDERMLDVHQSSTDLKMNALQCKVYQFLLNSVISSRENTTVNFLRLVLVWQPPINDWRLLLLLNRTTYVHTELMS